MTCPECGGPRLAGHPAGELALQHRIDCTLLRAEDATQAADHERGTHKRPATSTERVLLAHAGHHLPDDELTTSVERVTRAIIRRTWPQLSTGVGSPPPPPPSPRSALQIAVRAHAHERFPEPPKET